MQYNIRNTRKSAYSQEVEFYNGTEWKSISQYKKGEKVLSFFWEDNHTELLEPIEYIKMKNSNMVRLKVKGLNMSLDRQTTFIGDYRDGVYDDCRKTIFSLEQALNNNYAVFVHCRAYNSFSYPTTTTSMLSADRLKVMTLSIMYGEINGLHCTLKTKNKTLKKHMVRCLKNSKIDYKSKLIDGENVFTYILPRAKDVFCNNPLMLSDSEVHIVMDELEMGFVKNKMLCDDKEVQDFIQMVYARGGKRVIIDYKAKALRKSKNGYTLIERNASHCKSSEKIQYSFTTKGGYFVIRNNGRIFVLGDYKR